LWRPQLVPTGNLEEPNNWQAEQATIERERREVIQEFVRHGTLDQLLRLADHAAEPEAVGYYVGHSDLSDEFVSGLVANCLRSEDGKRKQCSHGIIRGRFFRYGWAWVDKVFSADKPGALPSISKATFALALPFETAVWNWVEGWGEDVATEYWRSTRVGWCPDGRCDAPRAIQTLLDRGRVFAAFRMARLCASGDRAVPAALLLAVIRAVTAVARGDTQATDELTPDSDFGYHLGELLDVVGSAGITEDQEVAQIEWIWLSALEHTQWGLAALNRQLTREPALFAQAVGLIFRPRHSGREEEPVPELDELTRARGLQAFRLLREWSGMPGRREDGSINEGELRAWVISARRECASTGHHRVGDCRIGEVLARSPQGDDGYWPHETVRSLIEEIQSEDIEDGVFLGVVNGREATCRTLDTGGEPERELASLYAGWITALAGSYPRTTRVLQKLRDSYLQNGRWHDDQRDLNEYH
jgi:hypothetical protein